MTDGKPIYDQKFIDDTIAKAITGVFIAGNTVGVTIVVTIVIMRRKS